MHVYFYGKEYHRAVVLGAVWAEKLTRGGAEKLERPPNKDISVVTK